MNKHFDKLLLVLGLLVCGAGFGFTGWAYLEQAKADKNPAATIAKNSANTDASGTKPDKTYPRVNLPNPVVETDLWSELRRDEEDDVLWNNDLFTPADVQWNRAEAAYQPAGTTAAPDEPFGIKLLSISRPVYRVLLKGEVPRRAKDGTITRLAQIYDSEGTVQDANGNTSRPYYNVTTGQRINKNGLDITIRDYQSKSVTHANGAREHRKTLILFDNTLKREISLLLNVPFEFEESTNIVLARENAPTDSWVWHSTGERKKVDNLGEFSLKTIDFQNKTVTIEKTYEKGIGKKKTTKKQTETLSVETEKTPGQTPGTNS
jgi:hypothetical protein